MTPMLIKEFLKQFVQALIAAWIVSMIAAGFVTRVGVVTAIGVSAGIATNVSYWNWYGFPLDYTLAQIIIEVVSALVAGLAIAAVIDADGVINLPLWGGRRAAKRARRVEACAARTEKCFAFFDLPTRGR